MLRTWKAVGSLVVAVGLLATAMPEKAWGRAGGGTSLGSRGSRSFSSPSRSYSAPSRPSSPSTQPVAPTGPSPTPTPQPAPMGGAGGFWRSLAGGALGGLLGGMLFRSLGFAGGEGGFGAGSGAGFGLLDILLLAGIGFLILYMVRRGRRTGEATAAGHFGRVSADSYGGSSTPAAAAQTATALVAEDLPRGLAHIRQMDSRFDVDAFKEWCSDAFFRIQAAWMHRDLEKLRPMLTEQMQEEFRKQIEDLQAKRQLNKLENVAVRSVELTEAWQEQGLDYITVRFVANMLDYNVDETSGRILSGSDSEPVKFDEFWTWVRPVGPSPWRLGAINQPD